MNQKIVMRNEDQEVEVSGTEQPVEIQQETIKLNETHIDLIVKEFDVDRFQATRWLKRMREIYKNHQVDNQQLNQLFIN